jgi:hypothetical protein
VWRITDFPRISNSPHTSDGKIATAKNPRKWPNLFQYRAALIGAATPGTEVPPACITLPGGSTVSTEQPDASRILSTALNREVRLVARKVEEHDRKITVLVDTVQRLLAPTPAKKYPIGFVPSDD